MPVNVIYGILALLMIAAAFGAPSEDRRRAVAVSVLLFANWVCFVLAWTDYKPKLVFAAVGMPLTNIDMWALLDALAASCIIAVAYDRWWGLALWGMLVAQLAGHSLYQGGLVAYAPYSAALDALFLAQVAVFLLLGGGGIVNLVARIRAGPGGSALSVEAPEKGA